MELFCHDERFVAELRRIEAPWSESFVKKLSFVVPGKKWYDRARAQTSLIVTFHCPADFFVARSWKRPRW